MPGPAAPFIDNLSLAATGFAEGHSVLSEAQGLGVDAARPLVSYGNQLFAGAFTQVEAAARRYLQTTEYLNAGAPRLILSDSAFQAAAQDCAEKLEAAAALLSVAGKRLPPSLRRWGNNPAEARVIAVGCDAAARLAKTRSGRAS